MKPNCMQQKEERTKGELLGKHCILLSFWYSEGMLEQEKREKRLLVLWSPIAWILSSSSLMRTSGQMARTSASVRDLTGNQETRKQLRCWICNLLLKEINVYLKPFNNPSRDGAPTTDSGTAYCSSCPKGLILLTLQHRGASFPHMIPWGTSLTIHKL